MRRSSYGCTQERMSLESTQEARVELGYRLVQLTLTHLSCSPNFPCTSMTRYTHAKHEQILKFTPTICQLNWEDGMEVSFLISLDLYPSHKSASTQKHCRQLLLFATFHNSDPLLNISLSPGNTFPTIFFQFYAILFYTGNCQFRDAQRAEATFSRYELAWEK